MQAKDNPEEMKEFDEAMAQFVVWKAATEKDFNIPPSRYQRTTIPEYLAISTNRMLMIRRLNIIGRSTGSREYTDDLICQIK